MTDKNKERETNVLLPSENLTQESTVVEEAIHEALETLSAGEGFRLSPILLRRLHSEEDEKVRFRTQEATEILHELEVVLAEAPVSPGVVVSVEPLLVACYSEEMDAVALVRFSEKLGEMYGLSLHSKLLCVTPVLPSARPASDLTPGSQGDSSIPNFWPVVVDFLTMDVQKVQSVKSSLSETKWRRCKQLGEQYLLRKKGLYRDGSPYVSDFPCKKKRWKESLGIWSKITRYAFAILTVVVGGTMVYLSTTPQESEKVLMLFGGSAGLLIGFGFFLKGWNRTLYFRVVGGTVILICAVILLIDSDDIEDILDNVEVISMLLLAIKAALWKDEDED